MVYSICIFMRREICCERIDMSKFTNKLCPVCRAPFTEDADIVVCPQCGAPHHRVCYMTKNRCGLEEYHAQGYVWNGRLPDEEPEPEPENTDPHHAEYPADTPVPKIMPAIQDIEDMESPEEYYKKMVERLNDSTEGDDGVSIRELCAYASTSVFHYGRAFSVFRSGTVGKRPKIFMNLCSGLFAPVYQFYRKMDLLGIAALLITVASSLPLLLVYGGILEDNDGVYILVSLCRFLSFVMTVVLCLFGDYLYYRHAIKRIKKIRSRTQERGEAYYESLSESGRPSWLRAVIGFLALMLTTASMGLLPRLISG